MEREHHIVYLGLGANIGNRQETLLRAYEEIEKLIGTIARRSAFIESEPWGFESENRFLNSVVCCETTLSPRELLQQTQAIERLLGKNGSHATERHSPTSRCSSSPTYHDRPIDIDILLYDDLHIDEPDLHIPHPLMHERDFVMKPLMEIWEEY